MAKTSLDKSIKPKFRSAYDPPVRVGFKTIGESLTNGEFAEGLRIQNMIERYDTEGLLSTMNKTATYGDFTNVNDLHSAIEKVNNANEDFQTIPSYIRERFRNDPKLFYDFASNNENYDELVDMGLIENPRPKIQSEPIEESQPKVEKTQEPSNDGS